MTRRVASFDSQSVGAAPRLSDLRMTRAEALARRLETEIVTESLPAGEHLGTKEQLRQRFGVAAATINEAVRLMEMRGLISARPGPGGGVFVANVASRSRLAQIALGFDGGKATLRDCVELRTALEPLVCRRAAEHCKSQDIVAMRKIVDAMEQVLNDDRAYLQLNWVLHRMIGDLCANAPLHSIYRTLIDVLDDGLDDFDFAGSTAEGVTIHRNLIEAIAAGDPGKVEMAVNGHAANSPLHG